MNGGALVADVLERHGVPFVYTLCGGHISPILVESEKRGIRIVDVRHEATAVFAADATARLTGIPGVAAVTAGPGVTNTVTALQNAKMAESPLVLLAGATPTLLQGRGALQDIDQQRLIEPLVKKTVRVERVREIPDALEDAFRVAAAGVPGPVMVELPVDILYDEELIREWYGAKGGKGIGGKLLSLYLGHHARKLFRGAGKAEASTPEPVVTPRAEDKDVRRAAKMLEKAKRPVLVLGSGAVASPQEAEAIAEAVESLGVPVYLGGMARGLLGTESGIQMFHARTKALKGSDVVLLAGFPMDFRMDYGRKIPKKTKLVTVGRSVEWLTKNRKPDLAVHADAGLFLVDLAKALPPAKAGDGRDRSDWLETLASRDRARDEEIASQACAVPSAVHDDDALERLVNPLAVCRGIEEVMGDDAVMVADGGDFVATASYVTRPRGPLRWLDPGPFGTLGVGAGFALAVALCNPGAEVWLLWGDGSAGYGLAEMDTFARHRLPVVAVVGNDASWMQIAREQVEILGSSVGTDLVRTDYHRAAEGLGARGLTIERSEEIVPVLRQARDAARGGAPVLVNAQLGRTDFRKGSISM
jgi:acetolactate synthase-1/2/3 large subunit